MNQPPKKRRWQFSLKVLLIVITMAGVGMGLISLGGEFFIAPRMMYLGGGGVLILFGCVLLTASPGVLIGYGYNRLMGAIIGGLTSVLLIYFSVMAFSVIFLIS